ncbi:hypothetical protein B0H65DRAFT_141162 [Neurospora tetraspora]|uniref:Uncharacterized protein n=1 Tax=Neurospora tetraspora TaxID=94610 RepID=A0AAE0JLQ9_9PEZI|nr:hypothetical protein B0H65DRAFT_141162 [Neurospora tetraspora]
MIPGAGTTRLFLKTGPRQEITGPPYQDRTQTTPLSELHAQAHHAAEFNRAVNQQREMRGEYLQNLWRRPHDQATATNLSQPVGSEASAIPTNALQMDNRSSRAPGASSSSRPEDGGETNHPGASFPPPQPEPHPAPYATPVTPGLTNSFPLSSSSVHSPQQPLTPLPSTYATPNSSVLAPSRLPPSLNTIAPPLEKRYSAEEGSEMYTEADIDQCLKEIAQYDIEQQMAANASSTMQSTSASARLSLTPSSITTPQPEVDP